MKKSIKTLWIAVVVVACFAAAMVGSTVSYFTANGTQNDAAPAESVAGSIEDEHETLDGKNMRVTNTGSVDALVRAGVSVNLAVYDVDLSDVNSGWVYHADDGYYYYTKVLKPGETTPTVFREIGFADSEDYTGLQITFLQQSVQATLYGMEGGDISGDNGNYMAVWDAMESMKQ